MRVRLNTLTKTAGKPRVDRSGFGAILGASIMTVGDALGHGFDIDTQTLIQLEELAEGRSIAGRWTHGNLCADGLGTHLGRWTNIKRDGARLLGDFHFSATASKVKPSGLAVDAPTYLMDLAESDPDAFGVSVVIDLADFEEEPGGEGEEPRQLARAEKFLRADFVGDPAANPAGLFSGTTSELAEQATAALSEAELIHGHERVRGFLRAYLGQHNQTEVRVDIDTMKTAHAEELATRDAKIAALEAGFKNATDALAAQRKRDIDARIAALQAKALPNAIAESDLKQVRTLLERGDDELATRMGDLFVQTAQAPSAGGQVVPLGAKTSTAEEAAQRGAAALFEAAGIPQ